MTYTLILQILSNKKANLVNSKPGLQSIQFKFLISMLTSSTLKVLRPYAALVSAAGITMDKKWKKETEKQENGEITTVIYLMKLQ